MDTPPISPEQALQYAPDDSSVKAAKKLAALNHWQSVQQHATADGKTLIWGEIRGSSLYQASIILSEPFNFACDCPSFKKPCKHGIALLVCYANTRTAFTATTEMPAWVNKHLTKQSDAAAKKAEKAAQPAKVVDEAAQAKRIAAREKKVDAGISELQLWLNDLIRSGLAHAKNLGYNHFQRMQQRLVDAQATGLATMVDSLQTALAHRDWQQLAAAQVGRIQLLLSAYSKITTLPEPLQADIRTLVGWNTPQEQVLANASPAEDWLVLGHKDLETDNNVRYRRQWLWGMKSQKPALSLVFAAGFQSLPPAYSLGVMGSAVVAWYPSAWPQRIIIKEQFVFKRVEQLPLIGFAIIAEASQQQAEALAQNPFMSLLPWLLNDVVPQYEHGQWWLRDHQNQAIPFVVQGEIWPLLALSGGNPVTIFGEWDGQQLSALSAWQGQEVLAL